MAISDVLRKALVGAGIGGAIGTGNQVALQAIKQEQQQRIAQQKLMNRAKELKDSGILFRTPEAASLKINEMKQQGINAQAKFDKDLDSYIIQDVNALKTNEEDFIRRKLQTGEIKPEQMTVKQREKFLPVEQLREVERKEVLQRIGISPTQTEIGQKQVAIEGEKGTVVGKEDIPVDRTKDIATIQKELRQKGFEIDPTKKGFAIKEVGVSTGLQKLNAKDQLALTRTIRKELGRVPKEVFETALNAGAELMAQGKTIDEISDDLRFSTQSPKFTGAVRDAAQQIISKIGNERLANAILDRIDDALSGDNPNKVRDILKKTSRDQATPTVAAEIRGQERTIEVLDEIKEELLDYAKKGGNTNIFTGTIENISNKIGAVKDPELRKIATKVTLALQKHRKSVTGLAFTKSEALENLNVFPGISKTLRLNLANIEAFSEITKGNVDQFYRSSMGEDAYRDIFEKNPLESGSGKQNIVIMEDANGNRARVEIDAKGNPVRVIGEL